MRRGMWIAVLILVVLGAIAAGVGGYNAGLAEGLEEGRRAGEVVRVVGPGYGGWGFFPLGFLFFPLFFFGIFFLIRAAFWSRRWGGPGARGPGHWRSGFEEWHRHQHEEESGRSSSTGEEPSTV
jgi:hypothetical protein